MSKRRATNRLNWDEVCRRAGGRRGYNNFRRDLVRCRLIEVVDLLDEIGMERGYQTRIAEELGVSRATICRDMARLGRGSRPVTAAERTARAMACLDRRAAPEVKAVEGYEDRSPPAKSLGGHFAAPMPVPQRSDPALQIPS